MISAFAYSVTSATNKVHGVTYAWSGGTYPFSRALSSLRSISGWPSRTTSKFRSGDDSFVQIHLMPCRGWITEDIKSVVQIVHVIYSLSIVTLH